MSTTFLISDTHFAHKNICTFVRDDESPLRPWSDYEEMEEELISRWNDTVNPQDKIYHLGDVAIGRQGLSVLGRLNGRKVLIRGNHDIFKLSDYTPYFTDIRGCHYMDSYILTHIPVHPVNLVRYKGNIHGHLHYRRVLHDDGTIDERYQCVCVEHTDYRPIAWEEVRARYD